MSIAQQWRSLITLSVGRCVPPSAVFRFGLYQDPDRTWDIVFDHEIVAYHRMRSRALGSGTGSRALLSDKARQTEELTALDLPMAPIVARIPRGTSQDVAAWLTHGPGLFCKTRSGSQGIGAFSAWRDSGSIRGKRLTGEPLPDAHAVSRAWRELVQLDDVLLQPLLQNHPRLAPLAVGDDAVTIRYITIREGASSGCLSAVIEIPAGFDEESGQRVHVILPIEPGNGRIQPPPASMRLEPNARGRYDAVLARLPATPVVPDWVELSQASARGHDSLPDIWAIAWDWIVTPEGPLLLEGNFGWSGLVPQIFEGGFLRPEPA